MPNPVRVASGAPPAGSTAAAAGRLEGATIPAVAIGLVAGLLSFAGSWVPSMWYDEAATLSASTRSWADLTRLLESTDAVHGVYYAAVHLWFDLTGPSLGSLRLFSSLAVAVAAAGVVVLGTQLSGVRFGGWAGAVFAVLPVVTWMGTEGRSAALVTAAGVWLSVALLAAAARTGGWRWLLYGAVAAVSVALWVYLALLLLAHGAALLWARSGRPRTAAVRAGRGPLLPWLAAAGCGLLLAAPVIVAAQGQSDQVNWLQRPGLGLIRSVGIDQFFGTAGWVSVPAAVLGWTLIAVAGWRTISRSQPTADVPSAGQLALPWLILPTVLLAAVSMTVLPLYDPRYLAFCSPAVAVLIASVVVDLSRQWQRVTVLIVLVVLAAPSYLASRQPNAKDGADWAAVAEIVAANRQPGDAVLYERLASPTGRQRGLARELTLGYPDQLSGLDDLTDGASAAAVGELWNHSVDLSSVELARHDRVWVIAAPGLQFDTAGSGPVLADAGLRLERSWPGTATDVLLYTREP